MTLPTVNVEKKIITYDSMILLAYQHCISFAMEHSTKFLPFHNMYPIVIMLASFSRLSTWRIQHCQVHLHWRSVIASPEHWPLAGFGNSQTAGKHLEDECARLQVHWTPICDAARQNIPGHVECVQMSQREHFSSHCRWGNCHYKTATCPSNANGENWDPEAHLHLGQQVQRPQACVRQLHPPLAGRSARGLSEEHPYCTGARGVEHNGRVCQQARG